MNQGGLLGALYAWWQARKLAGAMKADMDGDACVACDGRELTWVAEGAYRCNGCGYEGGDGWNRLAEERKREAAEALSPQQRRAGAIEDLKEARSFLIAAEGTFENTLSLSRADMWGGSGGDAGAHKQQELTSALTEMAHAQQRIRDATLKLGGRKVKIGELDVDFTSGAFALDVSFDNILSDWRVHNQIKLVAEHSQAMLRAVNDVLAQV